MVLQRFLYQITTKSYCTYCGTNNFINFAISNFSGRTRLLLYAYIAKISSKCHLFDVREFNKFNLLN